MAAKVKFSTRPVVLTASRLHDGHVVWLAPQAVWSENIRDAELFAPDQAEAALAAGRHDEARQIIVAPYLTEAETTAHGPEPLLHRERIRAHGPSISLPQSA